MTLLKLIDNCRRLHSAMDMSYLDLDPVIHLDYEDAMEVYDSIPEFFSWYEWGDRVHPVPGTFWYTCYGIRTFVERIES